MLNTFHKNRMGGRRLAATFLAASLVVAGSGSAIAGSFQVNPVNIALAPDRSATSLTIKNDDREAVSVRVVTQKWSQKNGEDVYSKTDDVVVSPPIFTIPAYGTQLVRIGLRTRTYGAAYRVILEEIPRVKPASTGIQVALRLNLPLYVLHNRGTSDVRWKARRSSDGNLILEGHNQGSLHTQILEIAVAQASGKRIVSKEMGVVLPASTRHWKIGRHPQLYTGEPLLLKIRSPAGETQTKVVLESR